MYFSWPQRNFYRFRDPRHVQFKHFRILYKSCTNEKWTTLANHLLIKVGWTNIVRLIYFWSKNTRIKCSLRLNLGIVKRFICWAQKMYNFLNCIAKIYSIESYIWQLIKFDQVANLYRHNHIIDAAVIVVVSKLSRYYLQYIYKLNEIIQQIDNLHVQRSSIRIMITYHNCIMEIVYTNHPIKMRTVSGV